MTVHAFKHSCHLGDDSQVRFTHCEHQSVSPVTGRHLLFPTCSPYLEPPRSCVSTLSSASVTCLNVAFLPACPPGYVLTTVLLECSCVVLSLLLTQTSAFFICLQLNSAGTSALLENSLDPLADSHVAYHPAMYWHSLYPQYTIISNSVSSPRFSPGALPVSFTSEGPAFAWAGSLRKNIMNVCRMTAWTTCPFSLSSSVSSLPRAYVVVCLSSSPSPCAFQQCQASFLTLSHLSTGESSS